MLGTVICDLQVVSLSSCLVVWLHQLPLMCSATLSALQMQKSQYQNTQLLDMILHILVLEGHVLCEHVGILFACLCRQSSVASKSMFIFACLESSGN